MSAVRAVPAAKFLRKTTLRETEANSHFRMLDDDIAEAITSAEADSVTPLMCKVYTRLLLTPTELREGERVLRFAGQEREGKWVTAWEQLRAHLRVSSETANKALRWMHGQGIIGYYAGKNGVGIRIFLNRAASSVVSRRGTRSQKILPFVPASDCRPRTSPGETPFNDSFAVSEVLDTDINPRAPKNGAGNLSFDEMPDQTTRVTREFTPASHAAAIPESWTASHTAMLLDGIISRLKFELEPTLQKLAHQAAAREHAQTRDWLESRGLPKAARVAQRETYNVLRSQGVIKTSTHSPHGDVGRCGCPPPVPREVSEAEIGELAEACLALFEVKGQAVEATLSEMHVEAGGFLHSEDASRVLEKIETLRRSSG